MKINRKLLDEIISHCQNEYPKESCGILTGKTEERIEMRREVRKVYKMKNISENPENCYFMQPEEQFKVFKEMRNQNLELVGIYHSHTSSQAYPSKRDVEMAFYPEAVYMIISLQNFDKPEIKGFKIIEKKIEEEKIEIEEI